MLPELRHRGGLPGHAEMAGKSLFLKYNTGPSAHGMRPCCGRGSGAEAGGRGEVKVFVVEGEGGLTPARAHETKNTAWGLGLSNLVFLIDWNDFGIDPRPASSVVAGTPVDWFAPYGWRVTGTEHGMEWGPVTRAVLEAACGANPGGVPSMAWFKTRRAAATARSTRPVTARRGRSTPSSSGRCASSSWTGTGWSTRAWTPPPRLARRRCRRRRKPTCRWSWRCCAVTTTWSSWLSDRLVAIADTVPRGHRRGSGSAARPRASSPTSGSSISSITPSRCGSSPGEKAPNRAALGAWGAYVELARRSATTGGRCSSPARLTWPSPPTSPGSRPTSTASPGTGWYERGSNPFGALLPTEITEFTNAGMMAGPGHGQPGRGPVQRLRRLLGGVLDLRRRSPTSSTGRCGCSASWPRTASSRSASCCGSPGHSGPETAEDSRTHFGIFSIGVTQLFPEGRVIDLHPWEYNEVPVVLGAAFWRWTCRSWRCT